jgi:hypothetical protein
MGKALKNLKEYLFTLSPGPIRDVVILEGLLSEAWEEFEDDYGGLSGDKIIGRLEEVKWYPPVLGFTIERHGAMKYGSSRAELQDWVLNVIDGTASYTVTGYRQVYKRSPALKTKPLAEQIGKLIIERKETDMLQWYDNKTRVRIIIGEVIPEDTAKQTVVARRKRFRRDLTEYLSQYGWEQIRPNNYRFSLDH